MQRSICIVAAVFLLALLSGCTIKIIPVQMARVTQMETYVQDYQFRDDQHAKNVLQKVVGEENWKIIEEHYIFGDVVKDFFDGRIQVEGTMIFNMSLVPNNHDQFYIQGFGRYLVHRKTTNDVILMAHYDIINKNPFSLREVQQKGAIELEVRRFYTRYFAPGERNYLHDVPLKFRLQIKQVREGVYSLDYDKKHKVLIDDEVVGEIQFQPPHKHHIIDMRGLNYIREDY